MRSSRSVALALALSGAAVTTACGTEFEPPVEPSPDAGPTVTPEECETSYLDYQNFAAAFSNDWCRGCHGSAIPDGMRQRAPLGVDFDDLAALRHWSERIAIRATGVTPTMPPAGGPSAEERALLAEWIACGARE
ncbi:MAG: hypothetical protein ACKV2T_27390 [Kofleriaceae bacterium]